jgi:hypothetical protein
MLLLLLPCEACTSRMIRYICSEGWYCSCVTGPPPRGVFDDGGDVDCDCEGEEEPSSGAECRGVDEKGRLCRWRDGMIVVVMACL